MKKFIFAIEDSGLHRLPGLSLSKIGGNGLCSRQVLFYFYLLKLSKQGALFMGSMFGP